ncbi:MAG: HNH endonuclease [Desulfobacteraceae bacterium]|nr:HNH endonuclease [Desulfobacteraceae bacterium]
MKVLRRDDYRCKICGRRSMDYVDVELNVHHVRPWSMGGLTKGNNLITLCRTCHKGLDPHCDYKLYELIDSTIEIPDGKSMREELIEGIKRYRKISWESYKKGRKANERFQQTAKSSGC